MHSGFSGSFKLIKLKCNNVAHNIISSFLIIEVKGKTSIGRYVAATALLLLMLCISSLKLLHTHSQGGHTTHLHKGQHQASPTPGFDQALHHCPICEFQFAQSAAMPQSISIHTPAIVVSTRTTSRLTDSPTTVFYSTSFLRGPPSPVSSLSFI